MSPAGLLRLENQLAAVVGKPEKSGILMALSKLTGYSVVVISFFLKMPQIFKILENRSVHGISKYLFYLDVNIPIVNHFTDLNIP